MTREDFLAKVWRPYPPMPQGHDTCGRIVNIAQNLAKLDSGDVLLIPHEWMTLLQVGDIVSAKKTANQAAELTLLAPHLAPGLRMSSNINAQKNMQNKWNDFLQTIRHFFSQRGFTHIATPTLVSCPGTEPFLDVFKTELEMGARRENYFLPTSPELHLKKALSLDFRQVFEIRPCFRNAEISATHQPEFWMLEWYRAYAGLNQIQQDVIELLRELQGPGLIFEKVTVSQLFARHIQRELTPETSLQELKTWAVDLGLVQALNYNSWDDVFYLIFVEKIEPQLKTAQPLFVEKYPPSQAAYARLGPEGWAERFEMYWQGFEICNAFHELNDPKIQEQRMHQDLILKEGLGKKTFDVDADFIQCLQSGMPPAGGIALGLERLFMALHQIEKIDQLKLFPYK